MSGLLFVMILGASWFPVQAQAALNGWSVPGNISKSGETLSPLITSDGDGVTHAIWLNRQTGFYYSISTADGWSEPASMEFPIDEDLFFSADSGVDNSPILLSGSPNRLFLVWQQEDGLRFSIGVTTPGEPRVTWQTGVALATSSYSFDAVVDADGIIHIVYLQPIEADGLSAGIYYVYSSSGGATWAARQLLYPSSYFSALLQERLDGTQLENAIDLTVTRQDDQKKVFVAFDNQPRKRVFLSRSIDGGSTWDEAIEVDGPSSGSELSSPGLIHVSANDQQVLLSWQVKQSDTVCFTYFQSSSNAGASWSSKQRLYTPYAGCPDRSDFIQDNQSYPLLVSASNDLVYLNAWDGETWSGFQHQPTLSTFVDSETFDNVIFSVTGWAVVNNEQLSVIGYDTAGSGDTWITSRSLSDVKSWFAAEPGWKASPVMESTTEMVSDLHVISNGNEMLHAFWVQQEVIDLQEGVLVQAEPVRVVFYSGFQDNQWSEPVQIFRAHQFSALAGSSSQDDNVLDLNVASGPDDRLWAVWKNSLGGEAYFSWADASGAGSVSEWSTPAMIATIPITARDFSIVVDQTGGVNIAYVIPVNEGRGVYLVRSNDQGKTWTNATLVFDAQGKDWDRISKPSLSSSTNGDLWLLFSHQSTGASSLAKGLYSLHSSDRGANWSVPDTVSRERILWNQMLAQTGSTLHRIWMEQIGSNNYPIFHQVSIDAGLSWGRVIRITESTGEAGPASVVLDRAGQIHLTQIVEDDNSRLVVRYWLWDGASWDLQDDFDLGSGKLDDKSLIGLGISPNGIMGAMVSRSFVKLDPYRPESLMLALHRPVTVPPAIEPTVLAVVTSTPVPQIESTPTTEATPTFELAALNQGDPSTGGGTITGLLVGAVASLLVIGGGVGYAVLRLRRRGDD